MKGLFSFFFISLLFLSCKKDNPAAITGSWKEVSVYTRDNAGEFHWTDPARFPTHLTLTGDGKYVAFNDVPAGHGSYQYDHSTRLLSFVNANGNITNVTVSVLDDSYLITDYLLNGIVEYRQKFIRN